jgi:hypothetical protein
MRKPATLLLGLLAFMPLAEARAESVDGVPSPRPRGSWVADQASGFVYSRRPQRCTRCGKSMRMLDDVEEKKFRHEDRAFEEEIGAVDHRVWRCGECRELTVPFLPRLFDEMAGARNRIAAERKRYDEAALAYNRAARGGPLGWPRPLTGLPSSVPLGESRS